MRGWDIHRDLGGRDEVLRIGRDNVVLCQGT